MGLGGGVTLLALAVSLGSAAAAPQDHKVAEGHRVVKDEQYGYSRQYMYGRRDHGAMHAADGLPWQQHGVKHGFYGMHDHYMIGRVHALEVDRTPQVAEVKSHLIGAASTCRPTNHSTLILLTALPLLGLL